jgi:hypothetical protein
MKLVCLGLFVVALWLPVNGWRVFSKLPGWSPRHIRHKCLRSLEKNDIMEATSLSPHLSIDESIGIEGRVLSDRASLKNVKSVRRIDEIEVVSAVGDEVLVTSRQPVANQTALLLWKASAKSYIPLDEDVSGYIDEYLVTQSDRFTPLLTHNAAVHDSSNADILTTQIGSVNFLGIPFNTTLAVEVTPGLTPRVDIRGMNLSMVWIHAPLFRDSFSVVGFSQLFQGRDKFDRPTVHLDATLQVRALVPVGRLPAHVFQRSGNHILQTALNTVIPPIAQAIAQDYLLWLSDSKR